MKTAWISGTIALLGAALLGAALLGAGTLLATIPAGAQDEVDAGALFRERCANCHTVPDRKLATDRAWLDQVNRTA